MDSRRLLLRCCAGAIGYRPCEWRSTLADCDNSGYNFIRTRPRELIFPT